MMSKIYKGLCFRTELICKQMGSSPVRNHRGIEIRLVWLILDKHLPVFRKMSVDSPERLMGAFQGFSKIVLPREIRPVSQPDCYRDRKSTRLNSSHVSISYAVFCLKKKNR